MMDDKCVEHKPTKQRIWRAVKPCAKLPSHAHGLMNLCAHTQIAKVSRVHAGAHEPSQEFTPRRREVASQRSTGEAHSQGVS